MNIRTNFLIATAVIMGLVSSAQSRVLLVPADYGTIGAAVIAARANDTVQVARGVYRGAMNDSVVFAAAVTLISEEGAGETVIDAENTADSTGFVLFNGVKINGFTFTRFTHTAILGTNANGVRISNCYFFANVNRSANRGGQVRFLQCQDPIIEHCIFQENVAGTPGGAIQFSTTTVRAKLWDCIFIQNESTRFGGAVAVTANSTIDIGNCIFTGNFAGIDGGGLAFTIGSSGTVHNCTFLNNAANDGGGGGLYKGSNSNPVVINSIFWENAAGVGAQLWQQNADGGAGGAITISYCVVQGGIQQDGGWNGQRIITDAPWFAEGREPMWGLNFYYLDPEQSAGIDVGSARAADVGMDTLITNPDLSFDQGTVDMGFHYDMDSYLRIGDLRGHVYSALSGQPVPNTIVMTSRRVEAVTDGAGEWIIDDHRMGDLWINFHHDAFFDTTVNDLFLEEDNELVINVDLLHAEFTPSVEQYIATIDSGNIDVSHFSIANGGSGTLTYRATQELVGDANVPVWTLRQTIALGEPVADNRIQGVVYIDGRFYAAGANDRGPGNDDDGLNMIWIFNREGELVDSFPQLQQERYGIKSMTYGADMLWAVEGDSVLGYDLAGNLQTSFVPGVASLECIAYDVDRNLLWVSGVSTDIKAVNLDGTDAGIRFVDRHRKYGMVYWPGDPDGKSLYFIHRVTEGQQINRNFVYKMNPEVGLADTVMVTELINEGNATLHGATIVQWDLFSVVFMTLANLTPAFGGDQLHIRQLAGNTSWMSLEPLAGDIGPQQGQEFTFTLNLANFPTGRYNAQLHFAHNALGHDWYLPIQVNLRPNYVEMKEELLPTTLAIESVHPNPFNGMTTLKYAVPMAGMLKLGVYDLAGREIARLIDGEGRAGVHSLTIDAQKWASGVYIAKLEAAGVVRTSKLVLMR